MQKKQNDVEQNQWNQNPWNKYRKYVPYCVVVLGVVLTGVIYLFSMEKGGIVLDTESNGTVCTYNEKEKKEFHKTQSPSQGSQIQEEMITESKETQKQIIVYVCGAVVKPGVYSLIEGSRLVDAVNVAGGFTEDAWQEGINLARTVVDAEQIYVPTKEERLLGTMEVSGIVTETQNLGVSSNENGKINLNTATKEQLMELPGIGEAKATSIIHYRQQNGAFSCIEDIMNISGIKESIFDRIKDFITV